MIEEYWTFYFPYWRCPKCGRRYNALEHYCFFCKEKPKSEPLPPRHQYRDLPTQQVGRGYYEGDIDLDYWRDEYE